MGRQVRWARLPLPFNVFRRIRVVTLPALFFSESTWAGYITWHLRSPSPIGGDIMLRKLPRLSLLLALGIVGASCSIVVPTLDGCWINELNSTVTITVDKNRTLTGTYKSAVSTNGTWAEGDLIGFQVDIEQPNFGFVVKWTSKSVWGSVTVWTGQMFGKDTLMTMWLLRSSVSVGSNWGATR
ncbi:streptavidin-V2-like [Mobula hypostoma]|uniref:streptavidin-V2-like n=1 Tax=Mobula hypostoma TaxID=723540 RepID=UPI002FC3A506